MHIRAGDHLTFVYSNIVSMIMKEFAIYFKDILKLRFIFIDHIPGNQISIPAVYFSIIALLFF